MQLSQVLFVFFVNHLIQIRRDLNLDAAQVGHKRSVYGGPVFIGHRRTDRQIVAGTGCNGKQRQTRSKQEIGNFPLIVKSADLGQNRERRVVDHHAAFRIFRFRIVAAGIERADHAAALQTVPAHRPVSNHLVNIGRGVAVVRSQLRLELFSKLAVFLRLFAAFIAPEVLPLFAGHGAGVGSDLNGLQILRLKADQPHIKLHVL